MRYKGEVLDGLQEATLPRELKLGDTFNGKGGGYLEVIDIRIRNFHLKPETYIEYKWEKDGKKGKEWNSAKVVQGMIKEL